MEGSVAPAKNHRRQPPVDNFPSQRKLGDMMRWVVLTILLLSSACSEPVAHGTPAKPLKKVDVLWVFDHSPGSCRVEQSFARDFHALTDTLAARGVTDVQLAVIADQQIGDKAAYDPVRAAGQFQHRPQTLGRPECLVVRKVPCGLDPGLRALCDAQEKACLDKCGGMVWCPKDCGEPHDACLSAAVDASCEGPGEVTLTGSLPSSLCPADGVLQWPAAPANSKWRCNMNSSGNVAEANCAVHWGCISRCTTDRECRDLYEADVPPDQQRSVCWGLGFNPSTAGCMFPPSTKDCPPADQLPDLLRADQLGLAHCLLQMELTSTALANFEGGLRAAWMALDPQGPNCPRDAEGKPLPSCQNQRFLRDDALLLIVFAGDEDDCSVDPGISLDVSTPEQSAALLGDGTKPGLLPYADRMQCQYLGDADGGDPDRQEGYCQLKKRKDPTVRCRDDCAALPKDSTETQPCLDAYAKFARTDKRFGSVSTFYDKFRSLKADPSRVMFASIAGDSPLVTHQPGEVPFSAAVHQDRVAFYGSNGGICSTSTSKGEFGSRYVKLARQFGTHGYVINWCSDSYVAGLSGLAQRVADVMAGKVK